MFTNICTSHATFKLSPLDHGTIQSFKMHYRNVVIIQFFAYIEPQTSNVVDVWCYWNYIWRVSIGKNDGQKLESTQWQHHHKLLQQELVYSIISFWLFYERKLYKVFLNKKYSVFMKARFHLCIRGRRMVWNESWTNFTSVLQTSL